MARVFTTCFEFNNQQYDAIITLTVHDNQLNFNVRLLDADLKHFFPDGEIRYTGKDGYKNLEGLNNVIAQSLMRKVADAITRHMALDVI